MSVFSLATRKNRRNKSKSAADTGTWPPKIKKINPYNPPERPKTASLEKPSILDPSLVNKLDMSLLSKELLCDSMTRIQLGVRKSGGGLSSSDRRSNKCSALSSLTAEGKTALSTTRQHQKRRSVEHLIVEQLGPIVMKKQGSQSPPANLAARQIKRRTSEIKKIDDNNNKKLSLSTVRTIKSSRTSLPAEIEVFTNTTTKLLAPEPCKTCGRPDQPERFHSHPKGIIPIKILPKQAANEQKPKDVEKKTVQKPVALNFRSEKRKNKIREEEIELENQQSIEITMKNDAGMESRPVSTRKGPRTVTCYICAREFGTASFPIHEPKCMQVFY